MAPASTPDAPRYQRSPTALWRRLATRVVVASSEPGAEPVVLNDTGALIWDLLDQPRTVDELTDALALLRDGDRGLILQGTNDLLHSLVRLDVVVAR